MDFLNEQNSYLIDCDIVNVPWHNDVELSAGHRWAEPNVEHLRQLMRHVFEHREEAKTKAALGRGEMIEMWDWDDVVRRHWVPELERLLQS